MTSIWDASAVPQLDSGQGPPPEECDVVVVGAGVVGLSAAVRLARAGRRVAVVADGEPGGGTTGRSTGKLTLLQGTRLSQVRHGASLEVAGAYLQAGRVGLDWLAALGLPEGGAWRTAPAYTAATTEDGAAKVQAELETASALGLPVQRADASESPFPAELVVRLDGQLMADPMVLVARLVEEAVAAGAIFVTGCRVTRVEVDGDLVHLTTERGSLRAGHAIIATGSPIVDRGGDFARLKASRSRVAVFRVPSGTLRGMHLTVDAEPRSLRPVTRDGVDYLLAAGSASVVGRAHSTAALAEELRAAVLERFPEAEPVAEWAAQDYESLDGAPYAGPVGSSGRIHVATGFGKWGLTVGAAAALAVAEGILDHRPDWADRLFDRRPTLGDAATAISWNAQVAGRLVSGLASSAVIGDRELEEGEGRVEVEGVHPVAASRVGGTERKVSAICTHLGGVLAWNDAECSWDCPLHGSRFAADGRRLEGPAERDLEPRDRP